MDELITDSGISLDLGEKVPIPVNKSIADFREPDKRQRSFSKEIELPGTAKNQAFFASAFHLTKVGGLYDFNASAKVNCVYKKNGNMVLPDAVIRLKKVVIINQKPKFKVELFSDFVDIFLTLSNTDIRELDWSAYDHLLNNANIIASWSTPDGSGYRYPLVERNQRASISAWKNTDMIPYVHEVEVFEKCMALAGQSYTSAFLATARPKKVLFGYGGGNYVDAAISPTEINNRKVILDTGVISWSESRNIVDDGSGNPQVDGAVSFNGVFLSNVYYQVPGGAVPLTFNEVQDINNQNNISTFTAGRSGSYKINLQGSIRFEYAGNFTYASGGLRQFWYTKNNVFAPPLSVFNQTSEDDTFAFNHTFNIQMNQGDVIKFILQGAGIQFTAGDVNTLITENITCPTPWQMTVECMDMTLIEGSTVEVGRFLPSMKCSEFVLGFIRQYKLMISDPDIYGVVTIEPEISFYQGTNVFTDISAEVDHTKEIEVRPSANEYAKKLSYKYKPGTETDAKYYSGRWLENYGDLSFDQPSFFAKGEQKIELPWASIIPFQLYPTVIVPRFVDVDPNTGVKKTTAGVARIMFWNGLKNGNWQLVGTAATDSLTQYPCVHHFDDMDNPTFDLNFKLVDEVYYPATIVTTINLFSEYYDTFVQEIISPEGKYVCLYRKMDSLKIEQLNWRKLLMWNGAMFRFNKIVDFDDEITQITKIELIKVIEARSPNRGPLAVKGYGRPVEPVVIVSNRGNIGTGVEPVLVTAGRNQVLASANLIRG